MERIPNQPDDIQKRTSGKLIGKIGEGYAESFDNNIELKIEVEPGFDDFLPSEFIQNPLKYFTEEGTNVKSGDTEYDGSGLIKEDPNAVKVFPTWLDREGRELNVVAKKVNIIKSQVGKSRDPFYEYKVMKIAEEFDLPASRPIAKVEQGDFHLIIMEKVEGITWTERGMKVVNESNLTEADKEDLLAQAQKIMDELKAKFEAIGITRKWKFKDMIFQGNLETMTVNAVIPTDWEGTKIDEEKLSLARSERQ